MCLTLLKYMTRTDAYAGERWEASKETTSVSGEEEVSECSSRPDDLTELTQFRYFLESGGFTVNDADIGWHKTSNNVTTVRAEHQCLDIDGLLWFYLDSFAGYVMIVYNGH